MKLTRRTTKVIAVAAVAGAICAAQVAAQPAPNTEGGRFSFTPVREGLLRLDVRTGQVSTCKAQNNDWACTITPDERTAFDTEIGRLLGENARLKKEVAARAAQNDAEAAKADAARAEAAKAELAKAEAAKSEAAKAAAQARSDSSRAETAKAEAARAEALAKAETAKAETAKAEAAKAEAAKAEAVARADAIKADAAAKAEAARIEAAKAETVKAEAAKADALAKAEAAKAEGARADAAKAELAKADAARASAPVPASAANAEPKAAPSTGTKAVVTIDKNGKTDATIVVPLPSDQQVAEAKSFFSRAWQQFVETVNRVFGRG